MDNSDFQIKTSRSCSRREPDMDMTSMVDVTFLLLIFFMVTASFAFQRALQQPHAQADKEPTQAIQQFTEVAINQNNTYYVNSPELGEFECPSESEMRARIKDAFEYSNSTKLVILAHSDSLHSRVISAWDAGAVNGAQNIEARITDEAF